MIYLNACISRADNAYNISNSPVSSNLQAEGWRGGTRVLGAGAGLKPSAVSRHASISQISLDGFDFDNPLL
jgi:hypothetical protein